MENLEKNNNAGNGFATTIISANKKGTHSTVIPKPILNKFGLAKGQVLNWDIKDNDIVITPISKGNVSADKLGNEMLKDMLNNNNDDLLLHICKEVIRILNLFSDKSDEDTLIKLTNEVKGFKDKDNYYEVVKSYKQSVNYLLVSDLVNEHMEVLTKFNEWLTAQ